MKRNITYFANIYVGLRPGYEKNASNEIFNVAKESTIKVCQEYCNDLGLCLSVTDTTFVYTNGNEPGLIIGLINYPRFTSTQHILKQKAIKLAEILLKKLKQERITVVCSDESIMVEKGE